MINNYLAILGMVTFISGRYLVRLLLKILGPRYIDSIRYSRYSTRCSFCITVS
jgi:hypothetical protein